MAPSSGTMLIPQAFRIFKHAVQKTTSAIRASVPTQSTTAPLHRATAASKPLSNLHPSRAQNPRSLATALRNTIVRLHHELNPTATATATPSRLPLRSSLPSSHISRHLASRPGFAPFASTLRPNLTGGALPRSAGGYALSGNGVRAFSHVPAQQAQVLQHVSLGVRAFWSQGQRARFEGWNGRGEKRFGCVSRNHDEIARRVERNRAFVGGKVRGSSLEFAIGPTVTALKATPTTASGERKDAANQTEDEASLLSPSLLPTLTADFSAAITNLGAVLADLQILAARLGDLPLSYTTTTSASGKHLLRVRFPGCDGLAVECLCAELGIRRGVVREDEAWEVDRDVQMALLFPFADGEGDGGGDDESVEGLFERKASFGTMHGGEEEVFWADMLSPGASPALQQSPRECEESEGRGFSGFSPASACGDDDGFELVPEEREAWARVGDEGGSSQSDGDFEPGKVGLRTPSEGIGFDGLEGVCRFLAQCEAGRRM